MLHSPLQFSRRVRLFVTPWIAARQASLSITISRSSPSSRWLSLWCHPAISSSVIPFSSCPQSVPAWVFYNESTLHMRWPKYWSFSFSIIPSKEHPGLISNLDSLLKTSDITLPTKVHLVKAMVFSVVMYRKLSCSESWTIKKSENQRIDAFQLWYWRRLLRVPWTAGRSNQQEEVRKPSSAINAKK